jgi:hypothetical protein
MARGRQVIGDLLVVHASIRPQDGRRSLGHPLLRLASPEQRLNPLPLFNAQRYRIPGTSHGHLLLLAMAIIRLLTNL